MHTHTYDDTHAHTHTDTDTTAGGSNDDVTVGSHDDVAVLEVPHNVAPGGYEYVPLPLTSGIATSLLVETLLLRYGPTRMPLGQAASTAMGMSLISMLAMESVETAVNLHLTSSLSSSLSSSSSGIDLASPAFWLAALLSASAGFLAPLPYNYWRIKIYGRACH
ncbi:uncharacterized protein PSFLO_02873 [Pseudozyma flocculosa]|uniref:DUF4396 domain-containing protein n=1 Tax=Pseudozyma flocculosa TaxID=84751 RepID=A0A5C3EZW0_9BASI|nr:uncharacterized protein PSFLO_02873 [Pseudozyma flocculosa]